MGRSALVSQKEKGITRRLCCLTIQSGPLMPVGKEAILDGDKVVGLVTTGGFGHTVKKPIAYGYLPASICKAGDTAPDRSCGQEIQGPVVEKEPLYDPENLKVKD